MDKKIRIGVLMGGVSAEREISLKSGRAVFETLRSYGQDVLAIDIKKADKNYVTDLLLSYDIDLAFLALHGSFGEDGKVQAILDQMRIPYSGSNSFASSLSMDKFASRKIFQAAGLAIPRYFVLDRKHRQIGTLTSLGVNPGLPRRTGRSQRMDGSTALTINPECNRRIDNSLVFPLVVKPVTGGSSIGLSITDTQKELRAAIDLAFKYDKRVLVEEYIKGREMTVGIFEDKPLEAIEIKPKRRFFDYIAKYEQGQTDYVVPARVAVKTMQVLRNAASKAHTLLGCFFFSRVDIILNNKNIPYVLEVNTIPGFTATSLLPKAALHRGIQFSELVLRIAQAALDRVLEK